MEFLASYRGRLKSFALMNCFGKWTIHLDRQTLKRSSWCSIEWFKALEVHVWAVYAGFYDEYKRRFVLVNKHGHNWFGDNNWYGPGVWTECFHTLWWKSRYCNSLNSPPLVPSLVPLHLGPYSYRAMHDRLPKPIFKVHVVLFLTFKTDFWKFSFQIISTFQLPFLL